MQHLTPPIDAFTLLEASGAAEAVIAASRAEANVRLRFRVAQALVQGRIEFHYQPVVSAADPTRPAFFEMLARLRLPDGQLLPGGAFMPAVAAGPLGRAIDRLALAEALKVLAADPALRLSVNMSPLSMGDEGWLGLIAAAHRGGSGVCGRLIIEITEDAALGDAGQTLDFMDHVRATGCAFALDDFGAGATGFRYFRDFRFDMVKIDGAFVRGVHAAPRRPGPGRVPRGSGAPLRDGDRRRAGGERGRRGLAAPGRRRLPAGLSLRPPRRPAGAAGGRHRRAPPRRLSLSCPWRAWRAAPAWRRAAS